MVAEKPETSQASTASSQQETSGFFAKIISWFRSESKVTETVPTPEPAPKKPRESRDGRRERNEGRRNGRNNRRDEDRTERQERNRGERQERNTEKATREETGTNNGEQQRPERKERRERGERKERRERQQPEVVENNLPTIAAETPQLTPPVNTNESTDPAGNEEQGNSRRRGRRGGRNRGERRNDGENNAVTSESAPQLSEQVASQEPVLVVIPAAEPIAPIVSETSTPKAEPENSTAEPSPSTSELATANMEQVTEIPSPVAAEVPEVAVTEVALETKPEQIITTTESLLPPQDPVPVAVTVDAIAQPSSVDLDKTLADSGLIMVQTTATPAITQAETPIKLGRARKPKVVATDDGAPLMMIETQAKE
jgi:ribonuclease E